MNENHETGASIDVERALKEATISLRTGKSALENENYQLAEPLLIKALDAFELAGAKSSNDYFSCLHTLADTYFHLKRFYEAKAYYERLSVARLKNEGSNDAQVVVALLKLASTQEKLHEYADALNTYDLILELTESTIPQGHALMGVVLESIEVFVDRHVVDDRERTTRLEAIAQKKARSGFDPNLHLTQSSVDLQAIAELEADTNAHLLAQDPEQLRKTLGSWTNPELTVWAGYLRNRQQQKSEEESKSTPVPHLDQQSQSAQMAYNVTEQELTAQRLANLKQHKPTHEPKLAKARQEAKAAKGLPDVPTSRSNIDLKSPFKDEGRNKSIKKIDTDKRPFNPLPAISALCVAGIICGAVWFAHEYTKTMVTGKDKAPAQYKLDLNGRSFQTIDGKIKVRFIANHFVQVDITRDADALDSNTVEYKDSRQKAEGPLAQLAAYGHNTVVFKLSNQYKSLELPGGVVLYEDGAPGKLITDKMQKMSMAAQSFFATHDHVYPTGEADFADSGTNFSYENPLSGQIRKPVVNVINQAGGKFDEVFVEQLQSMRDRDPKFAADEARAEDSQAGLIECLAIMPDPGADPDKAGCGMLMRAYDEKGKLIMSGDRDKAYVIALKNGIALDASKASRKKSVPAFNMPSSAVVAVEIMDKTVEKSDQ
ncbi:MAG: tetratricopeptide repeat protein [Candidatus Melainabacteria bacterium]|jgi:tetratricopeptide (TPR) repeat protein|nr:tetratricopeptide repeat protein [Candidatus Melainabacteria bacterium]